MDLLGSPLPPSSQGRRGQMWRGRGKGKNNSVLPFSNDRHGRDELPRSLRDPRHPAEEGPLWSCISLHKEAVITSECRKDSSLLSYSSHREFFCRGKRHPNITRNVQEKTNTALGFSLCPGWADMERKPRGHRLTSGHSTSSLGSGQGVSHLLSTLCTDGKFGWHHKKAYFIAVNSLPKFRFYLKNIS